MTDVNAVQLSSLGQQYLKVEKEAKKLVEELRSSGRKRRQLESEVRFLQQKLRSFKRNPDHDERMEVFDLILEDSSSGAHDQQQFKEVVDIRHQFYEVEVKFADHLNSRSCVMESTPLEYPSYRLST